MLQYLNPLCWMRWFGQFVAAWFQSINWIDLSYGVPAILLTIALVTGSVIAYTGGNDWRLQLLNSQLQHAYEVDDFDTAALLLQRQLKETPNDGQRLYKYALVLDAQGKPDKAMAIMRDLVRVKRDENAARWVLQDEYFKREKIVYSELTDEEKKDLPALLRLVSEKSPKDIGIKRVYADFLIGTERYTLAVPILSELLEFEPMRGLQAAAISRRLGKTAQADRFAERALEKVGQLLAEEPRNAPLAIAVAQNQLFLRRFDDAAQTLKLAIERAETPEIANQLRQALGESIVAWINHIEASPTNTVQEKTRVLKMLRVATTFAPNNPRVLSLLADRVLASIDEDDEAIVELRQALVSGASPGVSHFIRGTVALMKNDHEIAEMHLGLAVKTMPNAAALLNNLAVALTLRPDADLTRALSVSNSAIEKAAAPTPHYFETRGQIYFRMKEYLKAVPDMERALDAPTLQKEAHRVLAVCYDELGDDQLAADHKALYDRMANEIGDLVPTESDGKDANGKN